MSQDLVGTRGKRVYFFPGLKDNYEKRRGGKLREGVLESVGKFGGVNGGVDLGGGAAYSLQGVLCGERADSKSGTGNRDRDS